MPFLKTEGILDINFTSLNEYLLFIQLRHLVNPANHSRKRWFTLKSSKVGFYFKVQTLGQRKAIALTQKVANGKL